MRVEDPEYAEQVVEIDYEGPTIVDCHLCEAFPILGSDWVCLVRGGRSPGKRFPEELFPSERVKSIRSLASKDVLLPRLNVLTNFLEESLSLQCQFGGDLSSLPSRGPKEAIFFTRRLTISIPKQVPCLALGLRTVFHFEVLEVFD